MSCFCLFFIFCAELRADAIRQNVTIRGLSIHQKSYKILQFADDAIIIAKDLNDVPDKIRRDIIIRDIKAGGLQMVDLEATVYAQKISWAGKLINEVERKWANIPSAYFSPININIFIMSNYKEDYLPPALPAFYRQCLIALLELKTDKLADSVDEALMQPLWSNNLCHGES